MQNRSTLIDRLIRIALIVTAGFSLVDFAIRKLGLPGFVAAGWDDALELGLIILWAVRTAVEKRRGWQSLAANRPLLIVAVTALLSVLVNRVPLPVSVEALRVLLQATLLYLAGANLIEDKRQIKLLVTIMLAAVTIVAAYGVYQYAAGVETPKRWVASEFETLIKTRVFSTIGNPNALGGYLVLFLPLAITLAISTREKISRFAYILSAVTLFFCLLFTFSRGAWIGFLASVVVLGWLVDRRILWVLGIGLLLSPVLLPKAVTSRMLFIFTPEYLSLSLSGGRLRFWGMALEKIRTHPVFGVGLGTFGDTVAVRFKMPGATWVDNHYLKLGAEMGLPGVLAFIWLIAGSIGIGVRGLKQVSDPYCRAVLTGSVAGLIAVAVQNLTASIWEVLIVVSYWWFLVGLMAAVKRVCRDENAGAVR